MPRHYDAIVIGLGGVGSFVLRALSERLGNGSNRSLKILGIEQFTLGHHFGKLAHVEKCVRLDESLFLVTA